MHVTVNVSGHTLQQTTDFKGPKFGPALFSQWYTPGTVSEKAGNKI